VTPLTRGSAIALVLAVSLGLNARAATTAKPAAHVSYTTVIVPVKFNGDAESDGGVQSIAATDGKSTDLLAQLSAQGYEVKATIACPDAGSGSVTYAQCLVLQQAR